MSAQAPRTFFCNTCRQNGVQTECYWDNRIQSTSGKMIPQEMATRKNHNCPFRQKRAATTPATGSTPLPAATAQSPAPRASAPAQTIDVAQIVAAMKPAIVQAIGEAFNVTAKAQMDRIEQAVAGLLMNTPTGATEEEIPEEPQEGEEEQSEQE